MKHNCYNSIKVGDSVTITSQSSGFTLQSKHLVVAKRYSHWSAKYETLCLSNNKVTDRMSIHGRQYHDSYHISSLYDDKYVFGISDDQIKTIHKK